MFFLNKMNVNEPQLIPPFNINLKKYFACLMNYIKNIELKMSVCPFQLTFILSIKLSTHLKAIFMTSADIFSCLNDNHQNPVRYLNYKANGLKNCTLRHR